MPVIYTEAVLIAVCRRLARFAEGNPNVDAMVDGVGIHVPLSDVDRRCGR